MMTAVLLQQLRDNLRSLRFQTSLIVLLMFFVGNGVIYAHKMDRVAKETELSSRGDEGRYEGAETLRQAVSTEYKVRAPEAGIEFILEAGSDWFPFGMDISPESGRFTSLSHARTVNYWMRTFEVMDWGVIVRYVLSFLCIVLSYNAISGEREGGTLRLALANPLSRGQFLMGKFLAHLLTLSVTLMLGSLISLAILALSGVLELNAVVARSYLFFFVGAVFYAALFLLLGMGISTIARTSATSLVILIMSWTLLIVVVPQTSYLIAIRVVEPAGFYFNRLQDFENQFRETMDREGIAPRQPELAQADDYALEHQYATKLEELDSELNRMVRDIEQNNIRQFEIARSVNLISPGFAFQYTVESLLGTGIHRFKAFREQANQYRTALRDFLRARDAADPDSPHVLFVPDFMSDKPVDTNLIPRFQMPPMPVADGLAAAVTPLAILLLETTLAFFFALRALNRTELAVV
jgi:ABC-type transport system involved in multi-copper enzyme maturation permease subunit